MHPETATAPELLSFLGTLQSGLAARASDPKIKRTLTTIARRAARVAQRLAKPTARSWRAFLDDVEQRADGDQVKGFLYGNFECQTESVLFLSVMTKIALEHAQFQEQNICKR